MHRKPRIITLAAIARHYRSLALLSIVLGSMAAMLTLALAGASAGLHPWQNGQRPAVWAGQAQGTYAWDGIP